MNLPTISFILRTTLLILSIAGMVYSVRMFLRRQSTPGPQKSRQIARIAVGPMILALVIMLWTGQVDPEKTTLSYLLSVPVIVVTLRFLWLILHEPTEADAVNNFAHDRQHCGRCGYSLTGNVSGRCSECGWDFPTGSLPAEEPDWSAWWRKWRIEYLRHYVWNLSSYIGIGLYCLAMAGVFWSQDKVPSAVVIGLLGIHLCINAIRVAAYLRRRRA
jgi:hypothetical protein